MEIECNPVKLSQAARLVVDLFNKIGSLNLYENNVVGSVANILNEFIAGVEDKISIAALSKQPVKTVVAKKNDCVEVLRPDRVEVRCFLNGSIFMANEADIGKLQALARSLKAEIANGKTIHFIPTAIRDEKLTQVVERGRVCTDKPEERFKEIVSYHQIITVEPITRFAREMLLLRQVDELDLNQEEAPATLNTEVISCYRKSWTSLIELVASLLVTYHVVNGNLERISSCHECGKFIFQSRKGCKNYCSVICRVRHNQAAENPIQRKCRRRQNAWIQNHIRSGHPDYLLKSQCGECLDDLAGGKCPLILKRNAGRIGSSAIR
jgi:hypothetical protein